MTHIIKAKKDFILCMEVLRLINKDIIRNDGVISKENRQIVLYTLTGIAKDKCVSCKNYDTKTNYCRKHKKKTTLYSKCKYWRYFV